MAFIPDYTLKGWNNDNPPAINAANLNDMDNQLKALNNGENQLSNIINDMANSIAENVSIDSDNWELGGITAQVGNPIIKGANNIRLRTITPIYIHNLKSVAQSCDTGYKARFIFLDNEFIVRYITGYVNSLAELEIQSNWYYMYALISHEDAVMNVAEASHLSVQFGYDELLKNRGLLVDLGITQLSACTELGYYGFRTNYKENITDLPSDFPNSGGLLVVYDNTITGGTRIQLLYSSSTEYNNNCWMRIITSSQTYNWERTTDSAEKQAYRGALASGDISTVADLVGMSAGWYGFSASVIGSIGGKPSNFTDTAGWFEVYKPNFNSNFAEVIIHDIAGNIWSIVYRISNHAVYRDWFLECGPLKGSAGGDWSLLDGKTIAIIGDSISTNGNDGSYPNVPEIEVKAEDVGVQLSAYLTYYDVQAGLSLGGHTYTSDEIGTEVTFIPISEDVGKKIGLANNYNPASRITWWEVMMADFNFTPIPVCWSGSSITSHEGNNSKYKTSYAWHDAQIRKCGIRTPGTMNRTAPDVIFIYRGTNDFSHTSYAKLTDGYFDNYDWEYPTTDAITGGYGYKEGLCLTIKKLRDTYPNAKIFLCTLNVFKRVNYSHFPTNNGENSLPQYNDAIREVADFMGCGIIEFDKDGITFENCYSEGYITDSATIPTHPSDKGHRAMGLKAIVDVKAQYSNMA